MALHTEPNRNEIKQPHNRKTEKTRRETAENNGETNQQHQKAP
jgi:hypothetical protein